MNTIDMITKIKEVLNLSEEVKLEQLKLENGTVLEADEFKAGKEIFILTEDEKVALPVGEYELEDGRILSVLEEGVISELKEEKEEEKEEEAPAEEEKEEKEEMGYATKEELAEVKKMVEEIKAMLEPKEEKEEMSAEDLGNLLTEELAKHEKVEMSEVPEEVQEELNQPAAEPIQANPEKVNNVNLNRYASRRPMSTLDRVLNKINN
jgi:hypothetical protein